MILRRTMLKGMAASAAIGLCASRARAEDILKMGVSLPLTGAGFNAVGRQLASALKLYVAQHGDVVAGRKLEITVRDDGGVADNARRIVQEMIVNEKVGLIGIGITPTSLAIAPLVTEAKIPTLVLSSGASVTVTKSPYMVRAGFLQSQQAWIMAEWAAKNGSKRVVTLVNDWAPGIESETAFKSRFTQAGGEIIESIRIPLANPDFAPFLQRIRDINPAPRSSIFRVPKQAYSPSNSPSAGSAVPASRSSVRATSPTTTASTPWATRCSASPRPARILRRTIPRSTSPMSRHLRKRTAFVPTSCRLAPTTACT